MLRFSLKTRTQADAHYLKAEIFSFHENPKKSIEEYQKALSYVPQSSRLRLFLASQHLRNNQLDKAVAENSRSDSYKSSAFTSLFSFSRFVFSPKRL